MEGEEVEEECKALLEDKRDSICFINVWSDREQQFVMNYIKAKGEKNDCRTITS